MKRKAQKTTTTERRNPRSQGLDRMTTLEIVHTMNREDAGVARAVTRELPRIAKAVDAIVARLKSGGRLIYVGAGTSGRLAVLDASECPPTFGVSPKLVQGIIAGGRRALVKAVEGAEDSAALGAGDLKTRRISKKDAVVGLTASGSTPYVLGALKYAKYAGAFTAGITCNAKSALAKVAQMTIAPDVGPEVLAGSTRLKAGTAQKMVLNMLSTATMVRLGHVYDNWMINVAQTNEKLRRRAERILEEAAGVGVEEATRALRQAGHDLRIALVMLLAKCGAVEARIALRKTNSDVRAAVTAVKRFSGSRG